MNNRHLDERTKGNTGISIGTHLALESLRSLKLEPYDPSREIPDVNLEEYSHHVFNLYTLVRNIKNAVDYRYRKETIRSQDLLDVLDDEIRAISQLYEGSSTKLVWFCPNYDIPIHNYNVGKTEPNTNPYREFLVDENFLKNKLDKLKLEMGNKKTSYKLLKLKGKVLITTHISLDLFNDSNLYLLESHTGKLRTPEQRALRYRPLGDVDYSDYPFLEELYYILGDKLLVSPCPIKDRRTLLNLFTTSKWDRYTRSITIVSAMKKDPALKEHLKVFDKIYN